MSRFPSQEADRKADRGEETDDGEEDDDGDYEDDGGDPDEDYDPVGDTSADSPSCGEEEGQDHGMTTTTTSGLGGKTSSSAAAAQSTVPPGPHDVCNVPRCWPGLDVPPVHHADGREHHHEDD